MILLDRFRRPEYTGSDRCWPCTIVNGVVLAVVVLTLALRGRRRLAAAVAAVGLGAIGLRGYLVPYTPQFAPRLVASLPGDPFHATDEDDGSLADANPDDRSIEPPSGDEVVTALLEAGVVTPDGEDLYLDPSFRRDWLDEMADLRSRDLESLAAVADELTPGSIDARADVGWLDDSYVVLDRSNGRLTSLPHAIAIAELAAARTLESAVDDERIRLAAGRPLRTFLESCPRCEGELTITRSTCCGEVTPIGRTPNERLVCTECGARLFTYTEERLD